LDPNQVERLRKSLRIHNQPSLQFIDPSTVRCSNTWNYLEVSVYHHLWCRVGINHIIEAGEGDVDLSKLLEILVLNRMTQASSKLGVTHWYPTTALDQILGIESEEVSESRLYRCLSFIEAHHKKIEKYIFKTIIKKSLNNESPKQLPLFFYDLTSSYFEG
jgi:hypothetical protein